MSTKNRPKTINKWTFRGSAASVFGWLTLKLLACTRGMTAIA